MEKNNFLWPVVPICTAQRRDVNPFDLLTDGKYRKCSVYKGGGGYDEFNYIIKRKTGIDLNPVQFVVQLQGCTLSCPYCYVTRQGVHGTPLMTSSEDLIRDYKDSGLEVFHLMGGAPALYMREWYRIYDEVKFFHSDFILVEQPYDVSVLNSIPGIHAVSLKEKEIYTHKQFILLIRNLCKIIQSELNFYFTFTGEKARSDFENIIEYLGGDLYDSFNVPIINYNALH